MFKDRKVKLGPRSSEVECGVFLPLPYDLARRFAPKSEDSSDPHFTLLYAGKLSPCAYRSFVDVVRRVARNIAPFTADLALYSEFDNDKKQRICHMRPSPCIGLHMAKVHGMLRRELEKEGIKLKHSYGPGDKASLPYELRFKAHVTLSYMDKRDLPYRGEKPTGSWRATEIECWGHERYRVPLGRTRGDQPNGLFRGRLLGRYPMAFQDERVKSAVQALLKKLKIQISKCAAAAKGVKEDRATRSRLDSGGNSSSLRLQRSSLLISKTTPQIKENTIAGTGPARGVVGIDGTLAYLEFQKNDDRKERRKRAKKRSNAE